eukprot:jgi/Botrbrau1/4557/Bobra.60_2s0044.1
MRQPGSCAFGIPQGHGAWNGNFLRVKKLRSVQARRHRTPKLCKGMEDVSSKRFWRQSMYKWKTERKLFKWSGITSLVHVKQMLILRIRAYFTLGVWLQAANSPFLICLGRRGLCASALCEIQYVFGCPLKVAHQWI